jgi:hypothetical protein
MDAVGLRWLLSVDPGSKSAWALWRLTGAAREEWSLVAVGRVVDAGFLECRALLARIRNDRGVDWSQAALVVEGQFYSGRKGQSPWIDVSRLIESRCSWSCAALDAGAQVEVVQPGEWIVQATKGMPGETSKERIRAMARRWMPGLRLVADEHDALLLGIWWLRSERQAISRVMETREGAA